MNIRFIVAFLLCAAASVPLAAQTTSGSITGTVLDAQGAVVPGATVKATDMDRNTVFTAGSDAAGIFVFPQLLPARYSVTVEKEGFRKFEQRGVVLQANSALSLSAIKLEVGAVSQSVEVVAQGEQLETSTAERGDTIIAHQLENVEVKGRSYLALLQLNPGVRTDRDFSINTNELGNIYANGSRGNQQHLTLNGVTNTDYGANSRMLVSVSIDAVQEFKVLTGNYQAQYGFGSGAEIMVVTKSGGADFHGSSYWYFRDKGLNANTWRNNRDGVPRAYYHQNYVGYTIGGPVYIPGKFNTNKDKLFLFWSDEYQRQLLPADQNGNSIFRSNVPTALERTGDFSQSVDKNGCPLTVAKSGCPTPPQILDPLTRQPFPNGQIPQSMLYGPGMKLLNFFPLPNATATGYNYVYQPSGSVPRHEQVLRLDYNPTDKWRLYATWVNLAQDVVDINASPSGYSLSPNFPITPVSFYHPGFLTTLNATRILTSQMTNEMSFSTNYHPVTILPDNPAAISAAGTGINLPTIFPQYGHWVPNFGFSGTRIGSSPSLKYTGVGGSGSYAPFYSYATVFEVVDNFSLVRNKHLFKAGMYYHRDRKDQTAFLESEGVYDYGDSPSNPYDTRFGFSNAALGVYSQFTQANQYLGGRYRFTNLEFYAQDTWKLTSRVTLDYGLRAYWIQPAFDSKQQTSNFLPNLYDPAKAPLLYQPGLDPNNNRIAVDPRNPSVTLPAAYIGTIVPNTGPPTNGIRQAGNGISKYLMDSNGIKLGPRVGVAIDLTGHQNLIFRAGGGIMYDRYQLNEIFALIGNPPEAIQTTLLNGLVTQLNPATGIIGAPSLSGVAGGAIAAGGGVPTSYKYNAGIQAKLPWSMVLDTSYVGTLGRNLIYNYPLNAIPYGADYLPQNQDPTKVKLSPTATLGSNAFDSVFLRPYQGFGSINLEAFGATSNYNALQVSLKRRFASGLFLGIAYTWSKCMATGSDDGTGFRIDGKSRFALYAPCNYDVGQTLVFNYVYSLPGVDHLAAFNNPVTRAVFNGWQIAGTTLFRSGTPFSVGYSISGYGNAQLTGSPDLGARVKLVGDPRSGTSDSPYNRIHPAAFLPPQPGSIGLESGYNYLRNPGLNNWDLSLQKNIPLKGERFRMELRGDAFNVFNHPQFNGINSTINFASPTSTAPIPSSLFPANLNGFGTVTGTAPARIMQLMARFVF
jgi:hypothetical protein